MECWRWMVPRVRDVIWWANDTIGAGVTSKGKCSENAPQNGILTYHHSIDCMLPLGMASVQVGVWTGEAEDKQPIVAWWSIG